MDTFTDAQRDAIAKILEISKEHFDSGVHMFVATGDNSADTDVIDTYWHGGYVSCWGAIEASKAKLLARDIARRLKEEE